MLNTDYGRIESHSLNLNENKVWIMLNTDYGRIESLHTSNRKPCSLLRSLNTDYGRIERCLRCYDVWMDNLLNTDYGRIERREFIRDSEDIIVLNTDYGRIKRINSSELSIQLILS